MKFPSLIIAAAALALPSVTQAATVIITYQGVIEDGLDVTGVFGVAGRNLTGLSYTSVYSLIEPLAGAISSNDGVTGSTYGGTNYGVASPVSGTLTIAGVTVAIGGTYLGIAQQINGLPTPTGFDFVFHEAQDAFTTPSLDVNNYVYNVIRSDTVDFLSSSDYFNSLIYNVNAGDTATGAFSFATDDLNNGTTPVSAFGSLLPQSINIVGFFIAVPEPGTWAMMIFGFATIGGAMRRQKTPVRIRYAIK